MNPLKQLVKLAITQLSSQEDWLVRARTAEKVFSWTFDDGPDPIHTPFVLDALHQVGARATFFVVGDRAARHPDLVRRIVAEGHELGNHTWSHSEPAQTSTSVFLDEVERTQDFLEKLTRIRPRWIRPPKGALTFGKWRGLREKQLSIALWSHDPKDWRMKSAEELVTWCEATIPKPGDVVLLHDVHRFAGIAVRLWARESWYRDWKAITLSQLVPRSRDAKVTEDAALDETAFNTLSETRPFIPMSTDNFVLQAVNSDETPMNKVEEPRRASRQRLNEEQIAIDMFDA
jgi:peptidoglycan/xylan/chitin deacetylase (PgdA/CDA1 family)